MKIIIINWSSTENCTTKYGKEYHILNNYKLAQKYTIVFNK